MEPPEKREHPRPGVAAEPPRVIWPSCGAFCDIFWWARP